MKLAAVKAQIGAACLPLALLFEGYPVKIRTIMSTGILVLAGWSIGCDSKPTPATDPAPPPPAGHQNFANQKTRMPTPTTPAPKSP